MMWISFVLLLFVCQNHAASMPLSSASSHDIYMDILEEDSNGYWLPKKYNNATNLANWMRDSPLAKSCTLKNMTLPGTHDSGAYWLSKTEQPGAFSDIGSEFYSLAEKLHLPLDKVVAAWSLAQSLDFYEQAVRGIRYFDVRCGWNGSEWVSFHGLQGHPIRILLQDIARFLEEHTMEVVVVEMSHFIGNPSSDNLEQLVQLVEDTLGKYLYPQDSAFHQTIWEMAMLNKRAVVTMEYEEIPPTIFPGGTIFNTYANSDQVNTMEHFNEDQMKVFLSRSWGDSPLFKISWTLTPQTQTVVSSPLPKHPRSLKELAHLGNLQLDSWSRNHKTAVYPRFANIIIIDIFEETDIVLLTQQ